MTAKCTEHFGSAWNHVQKTLEQLKNHRYSLEKSIREINGNLSFPKEKTQIDWTEHKIRVITKLAGMMML